jgi:hypothetical protein
LSERSCRESADGWAKRSRAETVKCCEDFSVVRKRVEFDDDLFPKEF